MLIKILTLMRADDYSEYLDDQIRNKKYNRVKIQTALSVIEKLKDAVPVKAVDMKAKRKSVELLIKTLKDRHI
jgi:hypothetical protein